MGGSGSNWVDWQIPLNSHNEHRPPSLVFRPHVEEDSFRMPGGGNNGVEVPLVPTHIDTDTTKARAHLPEPLRNLLVGQ